MDNNLPEVEIHEKKNYTVVLIIILLLVLALGGWYALNKQKGSSVTQNDTPIINSEQLELVKTISVEGTVVSVDPIKNEISINISSIKDDLLGVANTDVKVKDRIIKVTQGTVIQKLIVSKDADGVINRSGGFEINVSDVKQNDKVSITYNGLEEDSVLSNVQNISLVIETGDFEKTYQKEAEILASKEGAFLYAKGKVTAINDAKIEYLSYTFDNHPGTDKYSGAIQTDTKVYSLSESENYRINIEHAKKLASLEGVKVGSDIFVAVDKDVSPFQQNVPVKAIILISK